MNQDCLSIFSLPNFGEISDASTKQKIEDARYFHFNANEYLAICLEDSISLNKLGADSSKAYLEVMIVEQIRVTKKAILCLNISI